jgi:hypothetical protein
MREEGEEVKTISEKTSIPENRLNTFFSYMRDLGLLKKYPIKHDESRAPREYGRNRKNLD